MSKINANLKPVDCQKCGEIGLSSNPYNLCDICCTQFDNDVMMDAMNPVKINKNEKQQKES